LTCTDAIFRVTLNSKSGDAKEITALTIELN
jgi:hypothetical protein